MSDSPSPPVYRVLARKYRPTDFATLIGQDAMVRTLSNAIQSGRLAHAFVLTGVRGVGKTTTARIIARALNCIGPDGQGGPTIAPCGICDHCRAISEDRHVDILEMDAASRTGVNDIREIIDGVRYRPTSARYKIYIIDEVHMLSTAAFNALLKTLEEPPEHVKFIFATTEIRKIPVTVLSRCQRFDLRRVEIDVLIQHFTRIAQQEQAEIEADAVAMIARAADGSVRDGLSLLDQAISHGAGLVTAAQVRDMLGLADRARIFDLYDHVMKGQSAPALAMLDEQYALGADPAIVLQDMLELTHWLTRLRLTPEAADSSFASETERVRGIQMAKDLAMPHLTRAWQMVLKGLQETRSAPNPLQAAEMAIIRLCFVADLPTPADMVEHLRRQPTGGEPSSGPMGSARQTSGGPSMGFTAAHSTSSLPSSGPVGGPSAALQMQPIQQPTPLPPMPTDFAQVVALATEKREGILAATLRNQVQLVQFQPGRIELRPLPAAPRDVSQTLSRLLGEWTGRRWMVSVNNTDPAQPTLAEQAVQAETRRRLDAASHPLVQAVLNAFPDAAIEVVRDLVVAAPDDTDPTFDTEGPTGDEES